MTLSPKSLNFAKKILKFNPLPKIHSHHHQENDHDHQNCNQSPHDQIKPYLHVHDHRKQREIYQKPISQKLSNMQIFKQQGNQHFRSQRYKQAIHYYQKIIIYADYTFPQDQKDTKIMNELVQSANCNMGIAMGKLSEHRKGMDYFKQAMKGPLDKIRIKANYWLIKTHIKFGEFTQANQLLANLKQFKQQTIKQVQQLQNQLKQNIENYQKNSKNLYGQMFTMNKST